MKKFLERSLAAVFRPPFAAAAGIAFAVAFALLLPAAAGFTYGGHSLREFWDWKNIVLTVIALFLLGVWKPVRLAIGFPIVAILALYLPAGILYGKPSILVAMALLQTNPAEAGEFLTNIPLRIYAEAAGFFLLGAAALIAAGRTGLRKSTEGTVAAVAVGVSIFLGWQMSYGSGLDYSEIRPADFFYRLGTTAWYSFEELREERSAPPPTWKVSGSRPRYRTYVIVIGESQRRDYASVYGYPLDTTPYLRRANGVFFRNFVTPGGNTGISLPRLLSYNYPDSDRFSRSNNIVTLANAAGFDTWWISNQGRGGAFDNPIAQIGVRSAHTIWLKGNYADPNVDDDELLPKLEETLRSTAGDSRPKLIFLHLMGSHPTFCTRLSGRKPAWDVGDPAMGCYLTTYGMGDSLLERTEGLLRKTGESWSLIYFADHGLSMQKKPGTATGKELEHGYDHRENYDVPFLEMSSDSRTHVVNPARRSGYRLLEGFADWLGITVSNVSLPLQPPFWSMKDDKRVRVFGGKSYDGLKDDPAIRYTPR